MSIYRDPRALIQALRRERGLPGREIPEGAYLPPDSEAVCLTTARQLYGEIGPGPGGPAACCDTTGCHTYNAARRDPFWPDFTHPRWMPCRELYRSERPYNSDW